eukprot:gb/GECG01005616.1/.p1 GENE.gb/GECG01005616.1/~~gb/GECG01005616.1/.p1  ORF type:complete len:178 (+),score=7.15 gb/GECG01005616.1/:1-534(+)
MAATMKDSRRLVDSFFYNSFQTVQILVNIRGLDLISQLRFCFLYFASEMLSHLLALSQVVHLPPVIPFLVRVSMIRTGFFLSLASPPSRAQLGLLCVPVGLLHATLPSLSGWPRMVRQIFVDRSFPALPLSPFAMSLVVNFLAKRSKHCRACTIGKTFEVDFVVFRPTQCYALNVLR